MYKREEMGDIYVSSLETSTPWAMRLHLVSNDIVRELYILSVLYCRWPNNVHTLISEIA